LNNRSLVVTPWLEGGGAQKALENVLNYVERPNLVDIVILFSGSRNYDPLQLEGRKIMHLECPRTPFGATKAAWKLTKILRQYPRAYSLMRGSHVVLGMMPAKILKGLDLAATFHQLPKQESKTLVGKVEQIAIKRALRGSRLVTSPSQRGVDEIVELELAAAEVTRHEPNLVALSNTPLVKPREHIDGPLRLLYCGRITDQKGLDQIPHLTETMTEPLHVRIIGNGPEEETLKSRIRSSETTQIEFLDHVDDVTSHIDWCDAIFMPSREELRPMFVQEAWARGRSGIVSDIPAFVDLAREGLLAIYSGKNEFETTLKSTALDYDWRSRAFTQAQHGIQRPDSQIGRFLGGAI
jgi:glycosyltransferase involved in cell wall biosynthesis